MAGGAVQVCILCISDRRKSRLETVGNLFTVTKLRSSRAGNESHIFWPQAVPSALTQAAQGPVPQVWWAARPALSERSSALPLCLPEIFKILLLQICLPATASNVLWVGWSPALQQDEKNIFFFLKISSWFTPPLRPTKCRKRNLLQVRGKHLPSSPRRELENFQTWKCYQFADNPLSTIKSRRLLVMARQAMEETQLHLTFKNS